MKQQIAIYLRLSLEDVDKRTNKIKDESNSIASQRMLINRHLDQNPLLCDLPRIEFCDDGFSGTNFDRPDFAKMIEYAKHGEISCIVVKDLSRFGRDYLEVGDYLEHIFPFLGIRFKSINDHYDSAKHEGKTIGMDIAFKNLIYDYYSKDLSKKVKSAMGMKQEKAKFVNTVPYGYKADPADKHHLIIDVETAPIVHRIFMEVISGKSCTQIAKELTEEKVPGCLGQIKWYPSTVIGILKQEKHMGDALLQKTYTADFLTKRQVRNNGEIAQVYVKDSHKGIIDKQTWNAVQEEFDRREKFMESHGTDRYSYGADCMPFCEKVFCGECKSLFTRHSWRSRGIVQWQCKNHRKDGKVACTNAYVDNADLEKGFVKAFNRLVTDRDKHMERWQQMKSDGTPLEKIRAGQMMEAVENEPLTRFVPEIAQLVLCEVTVLGAKKYEFFFLEGSRVKVSV